MVKPTTTHTALKGLYKNNGKNSNVQNPQALSAIQSAEGTGSKGRAPTIPAGAASLASVADSWSSDCEYEDATQLTVADVNGEYVDNVPPQRDQQRDQRRARSKSTGIYNTLRERSGSIKRKNSSEGESTAKTARIDDSSCPHH
jgi:hypothetical protein